MAAVRAEENTIAVAVGIVVVDRMQPMKSGTFSCLDVVATEKVSAARSKREWP